MTLSDLARDEKNGKDVEAQVTALLKDGADPHEENDFGETAFNAAAANSPVTGRLMTIHWLSHALAGEGPKGLNDRSGKHGSTLAQYVAKWLNDDEIGPAIKAAVGRGLELDIPNESGWTPLMAAAAMGRLEAVRIFSQHYTREALCTQATEEYTAFYKGHPVVYKKGFNAVEIAQARVFQDEGISEEMGEALWECMDIIAAAIAGHAV